MLAIQDIHTKPSHSSWIHINTQVTAHLLVSTQYSDALNSDDLCDEWKGSKDNSTEIHLCLTRMTDWYCDSLTSIDSAEEHGQVEISIYWFYISAVFVW